MHWIRRMVIVYIIFCKLTLNNRKLRHLCTGAQTQRKMQPTAPDNRAPRAPIPSPTLVIELPSPHTTVTSPLIAPINRASRASHPYPTFVQSSTVPTRLFLSEAFIVSAPRLSTPNLRYLSVTALIIGYCLKDYWNGGSCASRKPSKILVPTATGCNTMGKFNIKPVPNNQLDKAGRLHYNNNRHCYKNKFKASLQLRE